MNPITLTEWLADEEAQLQWGRDLARYCGQAAMISLSGPLGAGKTTLTRGFLQGLGYTGTVKSPTYTLVEPYTIQGRLVYHFDLYRLNDPHELDEMGIQDYLTPDAICLIEWPERGAPLLPLADLSCYIEILDAGRQVRVVANTPKGCEILQRIAK